MSVDQACRQVLPTPTAGVTLWVSRWREPGGLLTQPGRLVPGTEPATCSLCFTS